MYIRRSAPPAGGARLRVIIGGIVLATFGNGVHPIFHIVTHEANLLGGYLFVYGVSAFVTFFYALSLCIVVIWLSWAGQ